MFNTSHRFSFSGKLPSHTFNSPFFVMRFEKTEKPFTVALVASKKIDKRSVIRNQVKRKLFHVLTEVLPSDSKLSLIFYVRKNIVSATPTELKKEVERAFQYANSI